MAAPKLPALLAAALRKLPLGRTIGVAGVVGVAGTVGYVGVSNGSVSTVLAFPALVTAGAVVVSLVLAIGVLAAVTVAGIVRTICRVVETAATSTAHDETSPAAAYSTLYLIGSFVTANLQHAGDVRAPAPAPVRAPIARTAASPLPPPARPLRQRHGAAGVRRPHVAGRRSGQGLSGRDTVSTRE